MARLRDRKLDTRVRSLNGQKLGTPTITGAPLRSVGKMSGGRALLAFSDIYADWGWDRGGDPG